MPATKAFAVRVADWLLAEKKITPQHHRAAIEHSQRYSTRIEEALLEVQAIEEPDLLRSLARMYGTRYVSTEKLSRADIDRATLGKVSRKLAEAHLVFPVLYDAAASTLTVVTADPDNAPALDEVRVTAGVRKVTPLVARPAAVRAAIQRGYHGDGNAFTLLLRSLTPIDLLSDDPFERTSRHGSLPETDEVVLDPDVVDAISDPPPPQAVAPPPPAPPAPPPPREARVPAVSADLLESFHVLVSLLESARPELRGHSSKVARLSRTLCERIGLAPPLVQAVVAAAHLHDLGKMGGYHLTALNVSEYPNHRAAAEKLHDAPLRLMNTVQLPPETRAAVASMYERFDGQGLPRGLSGKEIPIGARVLAVTDTYADLVQNPHNAYQDVLAPSEAIEVLGELRGKVFDPNVVDLFRLTLTGADLRAKLLDRGQVVLVVDPDPEETTVLELRLVEHGLEVKTARTASDARRILSQGSVALVVSEITLDGKEDGLSLLESARREPWGRAPAWVMVTSRSEGAEAQRAFDLGAADFIAKPVAADLLVRKLQKLLSQRGEDGARGVAGSLTEMSLPDIFQVLWHGRKTCALRVRLGAEAGEIHFLEGQVVDASFRGRRGEEAVYTLLTLKQGEFQVDPRLTPGERVIHTPPEALLLEGLRRMDEGDG